MQFVFGRAQMFFSLDAVPRHVVVIGGTGTFHLMDRFLYVVVDGIQIVPVMNSVGKCCTGNKRQA